MTAATDPSISAGPEGTIQVQVQIMASLIAFMGAAWVILAMLFAFHFRKAPIGDTVHLRVRRSDDVKNDIEHIESIELDDFSIFRVTDTP
ncbi:hypothetical protein JX265_010899 [Neoarthrinium moseri]|uniref:Uncharacterized protein n=1 Tax=Neoarthrinium moseri TaxID=1658444 RepID=A0A9P9WDJ8_9PEZI|nr:uncharacterized protein JN550_008990 [Neoarthrinium moseri]KAI1846315.1 hypothetical protein JX266_007520 [Neoarthrinium moseri]KAI1858231.1 hypothetical protein JX265_010899 [Neoarthrinium moseri]KAI1864433.1 hypothetical protein JN550_008990 [Neoarthrinium moseri]